MLGGKSDDDSSQFSERFVDRDRQSSTHVFEGIGATTLIRLQTISNSVTRLDICDEAFGVVALMRHEPVREALLGKAREKKVRIRLVTEITRENINECTWLAGFIELRHLDGVRGNFAVGDKEYYAFAALTEPAVPDLAIYSSLKPIVQQQQYLFDTLWRSAIPFEDKLLEIREGLASPRIEVIRNPIEIQRIFIELVENAKNEILIFFPTTEAFHREETIGVIDSLGKAVYRKIQVRIITPVDEQIASRMQEFENDRSSPMNSVPLSANVRIRAIKRPLSPSTVTVLVIDGDTSFILEQKDNSQALFADAIGLATYSTSKPNVLSHILFFETLWQETQLREKEERSRREAQLLQDILAHDMRNYNQIVTLGIEILQEQIKESQPELLKVMKSISDGLHSSTALLERASKLGKVLAEEDMKLFPVNLLTSTESALALVTGASTKTGKSIEHHLYLDGSEFVEENNDTKSIRVLADDLLEEIFSNIYGNSVRYTDSKNVFIETKIDDGIGEKLGYVKISISDKGKGIEDRLKDGIFSRYLNTAKGTGLGMSIVHALTVQKYRGQILVKNRVNGDYTKGTTIELYLHKPVSEMIRQQNSRRALD